MLVHVTGYRGMLGSAVCRALARRGHEAAPITGDITEGYVEIDPATAAVINCAGIVKGCNASEARYVHVNGYAPYHLAEWCDDSNTRLIHVSTDCVFSRPGPHSEMSLPDTFDIYARSKLAGEVTRAPHLTVRTSFVGWGPRGLLADLSKPGEYKASAYALWTGHTVDTVADVLVTLAERPDITGLLHIPGELQTRLGLALSLKERFDLPAEVRRTPRYASDRRLVSDRWHALGLPDLPPFEDQLERMVRP